METGIIRNEEQQYAVSQGGENNCGAIAMFYLYKNLEGVTQTRNESAVREIYEAIMFGRNTYGLPEDYCNPVKMIRSIKGATGREVDFYCDNESIIYPMYRSMIDGRDDMADIKVCEERMNLDGLDEGEYFIEILKNEDGALHYILVFKKGGVLMGANPHRGVDEGYEEAIKGGTTGKEIDWDPTGAGILIHDSNFRR